MDIANRSFQPTVRYALFNMEVAIMESMDWRIGSKLSPTSSGLLFLTGQLHKIPEDSLQALHHLIVATHMTPEIDLCMTELRNRHPFVLALACLASTLLLSIEAVENMAMTDKKALLREIAPKLGIRELQDDPDFLVCPVLDALKVPFVKAMEQVAKAVFELQVIADGEDEGGSK